MPEMTEAKKCEPVLGGMKIEPDGSKSYWSVCGCGWMGILNGSIFDNPESAEQNLKDHVNGLVP